MFTAFPDMPMLDHPELHRLNAITASLDEARMRLLSDGMSRNLAIGLESMTPGIFEGHHLNSFTAVGSTTKLNVALEAIDFKKGSIIAAGIGVTIALIVKLFTWIYDRWLEAGRQRHADARLEQYHRNLEKMRKQFEKERDELTENLFKSSDANRIKNRYGFDGPMGFIYANLAKQVEEGRLTFKEADQVAASVSHFMIGDRDDDQAFAEYRLMNVLAERPSATLNGTLKMLLMDPKIKVLDITGPAWTAIVDSIMTIRNNLNILRGLVRDIRAGKAPEEICSRYYRIITKDINAFNSPQQSHIPRLFKINPVMGTERSEQDANGRVRNYFTLPTSYTVETVPKVEESVQMVSQLYSQKFGLYVDRGHTPFDRDERYLVSTLVTDKGKNFITKFMKGFGDGSLEAGLKDLKVQLLAAQLEYKESENKYELLTRRVIIDQGSTPYTTSVQDCMRAIIEYTANLMRETSKLFAAELSINAACDQAIKILEASVQA